MATIAAVSAVLTAAIVIGAGRTFLPKAGGASSDRPGMTAIVLR